MVGDDHEGRRGELPEDIFPFIAALLRGDLRACEEVESIIQGIVVKKYKGDPGPGFTTADLVEEALIAVLDPKTLHGFRGVPNHSVSSSARPRKVITPCACFIALLDCIIERKRSAMMRKALGPTPPTPPTPSTPAEGSPERPASAPTPKEARPRPPLTMSPDSLPFLSQMEPHLSPSERVVVWELLSLVKSRCHELQLRGKPWIARVEWFMHKVWDGQTYKEIAAADGVTSQAVRDGIHEVRAYLQSDRKRLDHGESIESILEEHRLVYAQDKREQDEVDDDETRESERRDA